MKHNTSHIWVNGTAHELDPSVKITLLEFLREKLGLKGTKNGCAKGHCGACMVIVNGEAKRACLLRLNKLVNARVETIEGLNAEGNLHPIQQAFIDAGAVQCGFCTPGMIMSAKALLDRISTPTEDEIKEAFKYNICRCTGYIKIIDGVKRAAGRINASEPDIELTKGAGGIGGSPQKLEAVDKVLGKPLFADDLPVEKPLYGKLLFSAHSHAEILRVDSREAEKMEGVAWVMTAKDIPGENRFGLIVPQQPVLADQRVRYLGDVIAAVFAETEALASAAVEKISVTYKSLPAVFSAVESMTEGAVQIHEEEGNIMHHVSVRKGNVDEAFAQAEVIVEGTYTTPAVEHAYLEPEACLAKAGEDGTVTIWTGSQGSFPFRRMIANSLGIEEEALRVVYTPAGGAFGGKEEPTVQIHAALAALRTGRPVKMVLSREESIRISTKRHAEHIYMKHGATKEGKLIAFESKAICDTGAYISLGKPVVFRSAVVAAGPYEIPHVKADAFGVYTNNNPAGAFRGFGSTQVAFAAEVQMDKLAERLGMDPIALRRINGLDNGRVTITGQRLRAGVGYQKTLDVVESALKKVDKTSSDPQVKIGVGIASSYKNVGLGTGKPDGAGARIMVNDQGGITLRIGATDSGQGSDTVMAQIAAQALGIAYEKIDVISSDTALCPDGEMTTASRQTFVTGNAVRIAAERLGEIITTYAAKRYGCSPQELILEQGGGLRIEKEAKSVSLAHLYGQAKEDGVILQAEHHYLPPKTYPLRPSADPKEGVPEEAYDIHYAYCFGTQAAVVAVDEVKGTVEVLKVIAAQDVGKAIHPQNVEGQIEGSVVMGMGYALSEQFQIAGDRVLTDDLKKLGIPSIAMTPDILVIIVEEEQPEGPYGAKGMGEVPINPTAPAISNAIYDAVGVRLDHLPIQKERIKKS